MKTPFRKTDPLVEAHAAVDRLENQRRPLADRLSTADARVEAAQRARHESLVNDDPDADTTAKLDRACFDAIEARGGVEAALRDVAVQLGEAVQARDALQDAAARRRIAAAAEARATALDGAAESLAAAARAFDDARAAVVLAIAEHGVRMDNPMCAGGSVPASLLAQSIVMAAVRLAAPGVLPATDGFGAHHEADPLAVMRRAQAGRLRDHADDIREGRAPAADLPRPGEAAAAILRDSPISSEPTELAVFKVPISYLARNGYSLVSADEGQIEVPARVAAKGRGMEIAFSPDSPEGRAVVARIAGGFPLRARPRVFVDTDADEAPTTPTRAVVTAWPDEPDAGLRV